MNTLIERLQNYIASRAPHQNERLGGRLMKEALEEIKRLEKELFQSHESYIALEGSAEEKK